MGSFQKLLEQSLFSILKKYWIAYNILHCTDKPQLVRSYLRSSRLWQQKKKKETFTLLHLAAQHSLNTPSALREGFNFTERCSSFRYLGLCILYWPTHVWPVWMASEWVGNSCIAAPCTVNGLQMHSFSFLGVTWISAETPQWTNRGDKFWSDAVDRLIHYSI